MGKMIDFISVKFMAVFILYKNLGEGYEHLINVIMTLDNS
jgi:hypothetical protein